MILRDYISILNLNFPFLIQTNKDKITLQKYMHNTLL